MKLIDGKNIAYFRGRKLHGKTLKVPEKYRGVVVSTSERILPKNEVVQARGDMVDDGDGGDEEVEKDVNVMEEQASFEEIVVWGHEVLPDGMADPYVRGVEDWIVFAEQVRGFVGGGEGCADWSRFMGMMLMRRRLKGWFGIEAFWASEMLGTVSIGIELILPVVLLIENLSSFRCLCYSGHSSEVLLWKQIPEFPPVNDLSGHSVA